jgi:hypothetical protein
MTLLLVMMLFLAVTTHRLVERPNGEVHDVWLGVTVQSLPPDATAEPAALRCRVKTWWANCIEPHGQTLFTPSALPIVPLLPGKWEHAGD